MKVDPHNKPQLYPIYKKSNSPQEIQYIYLVIGIHFLVLLKEDYFVNSQSPFLLCVCYLRPASWKVKGDIKKATEKMHWKCA